MRLALTLHPDCSCDSVTHIGVDVVRGDASALSLRYEVRGRIRSLAVPAAKSPARADELWKHTCLEAFLRSAQRQGYCEFNFSPSGEWAAYRFDAYRHGMAPLEGAIAPRTKVSRSDTSLLLEVALPLAPLHLHEPVRLGLCAVIEDESGGKSYWALAHPPGKPDFHHPDCFALELPAA